MKMHTFMGKVNIEGLHQMDHQINQWLEDNPVEIKDVRQSFGMHKHHDGRREEPVLIVTLWYEDKV